MSTAALIFASLVLVGWLYWLTARVQMVLSHAEAAVRNSKRVLHHLAETEVPGRGRHAPTPPPTSPGSTA